MSTSDGTGVFDPVIWADSITRQFTSSSKIQTITNYSAGTSSGTTYTSARPWWPEAPEIVVDGSLWRELEEFQRRLGSDVLEHIAKTEIEADLANMALRVGIKLKNGLAITVKDIYISGGALDGLRAKIVMAANADTGRKGQGQGKANP